MTDMTRPNRLRARQRVGKYKIEKRLAEGGFAEVYQAYDTIECRRVAMKIPLVSFEDRETLADFQREVRLTARLDHPNILPIKDASFIDGRFVIVSALADESLSERLQRRVSTETAIHFAQQMLEALAHAHSKGVLHCDVKTDNVLLFDRTRLRLADFGIARIARNTVRASGSGTLGSMAPEQAMGRPSLRSDVFALGLILYKLFTGLTPEWPFRWPFDGHRKLAEKAAPALIRLIRRSLEVEPRKRYQDATTMLAAFRAIEPEIEQFEANRKRRIRRARTQKKTARRKTATSRQKPRRSR